MQSWYNRPTPEPPSKTKFEIRISKLETNSKFQFSKFKTIRLSYSGFGIRACFGLIPAGCFARASNFGFFKPQSPIPSKYPPAKPGALRLLAPQRGLTAIGQNQNQEPFIIRFFCCCRHSCESRNPVLLLDSGSRFTCPE